MGGFLSIISEPWPTSEHESDYHKDPNSDRDLDQGLDQDLQWGLELDLEHQLDEDIEGGIEMIERSLHARGAHDIQQAPEPTKPASSEDKNTKLVLRLMDSINSIPDSGGNLKEVVYLLVNIIKSRADLNLANDEGHTALTIATSSGRIDVVKMLIAAGTNVRGLFDEGGNLKSELIGGSEHKSRAISGILMKKYSRL